LADPVPATGKVGTASWYGDEFSHRRTASGERFDPRGLTGAHRSLPLGSKVRVTNLLNGRSVMVTITDRGPFRRRREIDLSLGAARAIGMVQRGVARVLIEPLS
jgi:rare lipoprotein A